MKNQIEKLSRLSKLLIVSVLLLLTVSSIYAQVGSTGLTRDGASQPAIQPAVTEPAIATDDSNAYYVEDQRVASSMIMPPRYSCSFDYSTLTNNEVEEIKELEQRLLQLNQEINSIYEENQDRFSQLYDLVYSQEESGSVTRDWEEYNQKYQDLESELGITQRYEEIEETQETLQEYFDGCYNPYDEEWVLFKLSDDERARYEELQRSLNQSYDDESELYEINRREYNRIYENSREENTRLQEELGITELQEQMRELQNQINSIRGDNQDRFNQIWEDQSRAIEELERSSGLQEIRHERENIFREIQELTGNEFMYALPMPYARVGAEMDTIAVESGGMVATTQADNLDLTPQTLPQDQEEMQVTTTSASNDLQEICESNEGRWLEEFAQCEYTNPTTCSQMGGEFIECGSACRNDPDAEMCTMQCVPYCDLSNAHNRSNEELSQESQNVTVTSGDNDLIEEQTEEEIQNNNGSNEVQNGFMSRIRSFFASIFSS